MPTFEPLDTGSDFGIFLFQLLGSMSELERATTRTRTASGRIRVANSGKFTGDRIPYSYAVVSGYLTEHPENAGIVREVFANVAAGSTLMVEAKRLTEVTGKRWREGTLSAMLHNRLYLGGFASKVKNELKIDCFRR